MQIPIRFEKLSTVGRVGLASLFVLGGINKLINYSATLDAMQSAGLPVVDALLPLVIALELGAGLMVAFGARFALFAALALAMFTLATNLVFHDFWNFNGQQAAVELALFFKNVSIAGGLIFVAATLSARGHIR